MRRRGGAWLVRTPRTTCSSQRGGGRPRRQRGGDVGIQRRLDRGHRRTVLVAQRAGSVHGPLDDCVVADGLVDDSQRRGLVAAVAATGQHRLVGARVTQSAADERRHAVGERQPEQPLGQAEPAAVGAHHTLVAGQRQHRAAAERVPVDRRDAGHRTGHQSQEQCVHLRDEGWSCRLGTGVGCPLKVDPMRERTPAAGQDDCPDPGPALGDSERVLCSESKNGGVKWFASASMRTRITPSW